ncbi:hypothetical protein NBRC110019_25460 [Neptunitalea chrysea]|uniref:Uncharacterized protein n=1 Tax=Neptunitalea chrysea TaxID=1647581 RepID=A0A9W6B887_9FLAO|nr:hypothetical protein [Neptunitalea chrysea]GLB53505.1 hypothetical protein NBRC110019_25460 [Neptunitalea chrysea]
MKVLQVCGLLDASLTTVDVKTMLPDLKSGGSYVYEDFYNLSVSNGINTYYVLLGVLKVTGETVGKLNQYCTDKIDLKSVSGNKIDYIKDVSDPLGVGISLKGITPATDVYMISLHEDNFDINEGGLTTLSTIRTNILTNIESNDFASMVYPKDGSGGPLRTGGCTF